MIPSAKPVGRGWSAIGAVLAASVCCWAWAAPALATAPAVTNSFGAASIPLNGSTSMSIEIGNPNPIGITNVNFTDTLPAGLVVSYPNGLSNDCGGTAGAVAGSGTVALSGGAIAGSTICVFSLNVVGVTSGQKNNSFTVGSNSGSSPGNGSIQVAPGPSTVTVGSPLTGTPFSTFTCGSPLGCTDANTSLGDVGAQVASPVSGVVVRWRLAGDVGSNFGPVVLRPAAGGQYTGVGSGSPVTVTSSGTLTFVTTEIPIQAGDLFGVNVGNGSHIYDASVTGSTLASFSEFMSTGITATPSNSGNLEGFFNADVQPAPAITTVSPSSGPVAGGMSVAIAGHDFVGTSAVKFGQSPASFTVDSASGITAISPPASAPGAVDVSVTTNAGTAVASGQFTYSAGQSAHPSCVVPKLKGKTVKRARKLLEAAGCELGKRKGHGTKVRKQSVPPGTDLPLGSRVNIRVR